MVMNSMDLSERQSWLLLVIDSASFVDGDTRLQKYGLVVSKTILDNAMYDDWRSHHYGAYSDHLGRDVMFLQEQDLLNVHKIRNNNMYVLSEKGKKALSSFKDRCLFKHGDKVEKIREFLDYYQGRTLKILLADVYQKFPEYTVKSRIKDQIEETILETNLVGFDSSSSGAQSITPAVKPAQFPYNDEEFRRKLAKEVGLDGPPPLDMKAYDRLSRIFADWENYDDDMLQETRQ